MRLNNKMLGNIPHVMGKFGCEDAKDWLCLFGTNTKGGMDEEKIEKYMEGSLILPYPNARDLPGRRVTIKADSGPGRTNQKLHTKLHNLGYILYPGVPNTTGVSQETGRNYGPFRTQFHINLNAITKQCILQDKSTTMPPWRW